MGHPADVIDDFVPDSLWGRAAPLLPARPARRYRVRERADDRAALAGIMFVLKPASPGTSCHAAFAAARGESTTRSSGPVPMRRTNIGVSRIGRTFQPRSAAAVSGAARSPSEFLLAQPRRTPYPLE
jgi:transposase